VLILYEYGNSVACQRVRLALCEKGLVWESRHVDLFRSEQYDPEYLKLNPKGLVPVLVHAGQPIVEYDPNEEKIPLPEFSNTPMK